MRQSKRWLSFVLLAVVAIAGAGFSPASDPTWMQKVEPHVWQDTAAGSDASFLIILNADANLSQAGNAPVAQRAAAVYSVLNKTARASQKAILMDLVRLEIPFRTYTLVNAIQVEGGQWLVERMAQRWDVAEIISNRAFEVPLETEENPVSTVTAIQGIEWNITQIHADDVWSLGAEGSGIVYANADTGIDWDHPALKLQYRGWLGSSADHNYAWWDAIHEDLSGDDVNICGYNSAVPCDDYGHGTHTLGTGVGDDHAGNQIGTAPGATWIACRNMEDGRGTPATYLECLDFFLAPWDLNGQNPRPDLHADVISNSYTCPTSEGCIYKHVLQEAVNNLRAAGILVVAAAGNSGPGCETIADPPAIENNAITIGATTNTDVIAPYSNRGPVNSDGSNLLKPDLVAPGTSVRSSVPGGMYGFMSGTSMATPHVAGAVALLWSEFPWLKGDVEDTEMILKASALHLTSDQGCGGDLPDAVPNHVYGYGRLDALAAYEMAMNGINRNYLPLILR